MIALTSYHAFYEQRYQDLLQTKPELANLLQAYKYQILLSYPTGRVKLLVCGLKPYGKVGKIYDYPPATYPVGYHEYLDKVWTTPYVSRAVKLIGWIQTELLQQAVDIRRTVVSNWFFQRAEDAKQLKQFGCTLSEGIPFHQEILDHYQPECILCIGNGQGFSSFAGMCALHQIPATHMEVTPYLDRTKLKVARTTERLILGVPHLSRYPVNEQMQEWISGLKIS